MWIPLKIIQMSIINENINKVTIIFIPTDIRKMCKKKVDVLLFFFIFTWLKQISNLLSNTKKKNKTVFYVAQDFYLIYKL